MCPVKCLLKTLLNFTLIRSTDWDVKANLHKRKCNTDHEQPCHPHRSTPRLLGWQVNPVFMQCWWCRIPSWNPDLCHPYWPLHLWTFPTTCSLLPKLESHLWMVHYHCTPCCLKESPISCPHLSCKMIEITPWSSSCGPGCVHGFLTCIHLQTHSTPCNPTVSSDGYLLNDDMCNHHWSRHRDRSSILWHGPCLPCWW